VRAYAYTRRLVAEPDLTKSRSEDRRLAIHERFLPLDVTTDDGSIKPLYFPLSPVRINLPFASERGRKKNPISQLSSCNMR
jgi:hypothetical protein